MLHITRKNFKDSLPLVEKSIEECDFISIDGEFTGLGMGKANNCAMDTPEERYIKLYQDAKEMLLIQFGMATFKYDSSTNRYSVVPFNFYVFPKLMNRWAVDKRFLCQSSSLEFLAAQGFDFNKLFSDGIPYLTIEEEEHVRSTAADKLKQHTENSNPQTPRTPVPIPDEHKPFVDKTMMSVNKFMSAADRISFTTDPCNNRFLRLLIFQTVENKYKGLLMDTQNNEQHQKVIRIKKVDEEERREIELTKAADSANQIEEAVGFSKVMRLITNSGKTVVGHNMLLDILHTIHQFTTPLPDSYTEFKSLVSQVFPRIVDTKLMGNTHPFKDELSSTALGEMTKLLMTKPFKEPQIDMNSELGGTELKDNPDKQLHEAGFDAYITGKCFITMANHLGSYLQPKQSHVSAQSDLLEPFLNKIFLMKSRDINYMDLSSPDFEPNRDHVFYVTFPSHWRNFDIISLFQQATADPLLIDWVDSNSTFVTVTNRKHVSRVLTRLCNNVSDNDLITVRPYTQRHNSSPLQQQQPSQSSGRKRPLSPTGEDIGVPVKQIKQPMSASESLLSEDEQPTQSHSSADGDADSNLFHVPEW